MKCQEQSQDSEVCERVAEKDVRPEPEYSQERGNAAAQERLSGEPIDIDAVDRWGGFATMLVRGFTDDETQVDVYGGVDVLVQSIRSKAGGRPIRRLSIHGHGAPGLLVMNSSRIDANMPVSMQNKLRELADMFGPDGFCEIHGCDFASGPRGEQMLYVLNELLGVPVTAGVVPQTGVSEGFEGSTVTGRKDEDGFFVLEREDNPVGDLVHGTLGGLGRLGLEGEAGPAELEQTDQDEQDEWFGDLYLPEVGDLGSWLFGT
ncbi:MAG: DUF4347 domain-containing protein [Alphaproteobacteria bacterium]|nr:DUF4347 domain-containing protein [Alphaproteobacteria bacterium]MCB9792944.1 DUF4347 domain-containing protein [Alphaproteobacteria bacterium]